MQQQLKAADAHFEKVNLSVVGPVKESSHIFSRLKDDEAL